MCALQATDEVLVQDEMKRRMVKQGHRGCPGHGSLARELPASRRPHAGAFEGRVARASEGHPQSFSSNGETSRRWSR